MTLHVTSARYVGDYGLRLEVDGGRIREVDLAKELNGDVFEPLRDRGFFKKVLLNPENRYD